MNEDTKFTDLSDLLHDHESAVANWMTMFNRFHVAREKTYKRSFAKRGEIGIWMNLARKYDRFEALAPQVLLGAGNGVTLIDTLVDTAMYSLKWLDVISKIRPEDFKEWLRTVYCKDTGMTYKDVVEVYPFLKVLEASDTINEVPDDETWDGLSTEQREWARTEKVIFWPTADTATPLVGLKRVHGPHIIALDDGAIYAEDQYVRFVAVSGD